MLSTASILVLAVGGIGATAANSREPECSQQNASAFAITYGDPLLAFSQAYKGLVASGTVNALATKTVLAGPSDTAVVAPNFDTLYMNQIYDISRDNVELDVPVVDAGRYWGVAWYTPYGDNYVTFGAVTDAKPGKYLLTVADSSSTSGTMQADANGTYQGVLYSPSTMGVLLIRIVIKDQSGDAKKVRELEKGFVTQTVNRGGDAIGPELTKDIFTNSSSTQLGYLMNLTALFSQTMPNITDGGIIATDTTAQLQAAGISTENGTYSQPECVNMTEAWEASEASLDQVFTPDGTLDLGNNWAVLKPDHMGQYGTNYAARAYIARYGYLGLTEDEALYPSWSQTTTLQTFSLQPNESYKLQFVGKPPLKDVGFWSLTMYNATGYLVPNVLDRFSLGDRSNLTYSDGTLVYGSDDVNSIFEILVQAAQPPDNYTSNWLPSPPQPGGFSMLLRFFAPDPNLQNGAYTLPKVIKGAVLTTEGDNTTKPTSEAPSKTLSCRIGLLPILVALCSSASAMGLFF